VVREGGMRGFMYTWRVKRLWNKFQILMNKKKERFSSSSSSTTFRYFLFFLKKRRRRRRRGMLCGFSSSAFASGGPNERCRRFGPHRNQELEEEDETWEGVE
jgi:hypothetical protein